VKKQSIFAINSATTESVRTRNLTGKRTTQPVEIYLVLTLSVVGINRLSRSRNE